MLSRLRKLLPFKSDKPNRDNPSTEKQMPFITGSHPWLKPYMLATLAHPPNPPSLNAHYLQAVSPVSPRRELTVYDGRYIIPAVLSQSAASILDADEDDTGVTTRNLLGHVLAPVSLIVIPDMTTTPPTATLLIKEVRVFADRVHQRPIGRIPFVYTDSDVCDALRAIVGRQLASYATATVLERADRAAEMQIDPPPDADTFFEKLLHDPSIPPSGLLSDSENFALHARRGTMVGGGTMEKDDHEALTIIPENPTPPEPDKSKDPHASTTAPGSQSNQHDPDWDIKFTQDPAEGGGGDHVGADPLPQTQHFAIDDDEDDDDDDDDDDDGDDGDADDDAGDKSGADGQKSVGERRIQDIVGNAQEDTLDGHEHLSPTAKDDGRNKMNQDPSGEGSPKDEDNAMPSQSTSKRTAGKGDKENANQVKIPEKRARGMETRAGTSDGIEESDAPLEFRSARSTRSKTNEGTTNEEPQSKPSSSSKAVSGTTKKASPTGLTTAATSKRKENRRVVTRSAQGEKNPRQEGTQEAAAELQGSPGRITRSAARNNATVPAQPERKDGKSMNESRNANDGDHDVERNSPRRSPRRSPRTVPPKTPPRRPRIAEDAVWEPSESSSEVEAVATVSPQSPVRRSPRVLQRRNVDDANAIAAQHSPLTRSRARLASQLESPTKSQEPEYEEEEEEEEEDDDEIKPLDAVAETAAEARVDHEQTRSKVADKVKQNLQIETRNHVKHGPSAEVSLPKSAGPVKEKHVERGRKRKALEISLEEKGLSRKHQQQEEPSSFSPQPFLDKIKAEIEEMKRFRDRIDRNPEGYKAYPDGFLPSLKPQEHSARRRLTFPPPSRKLSRVLDVPESAPM